MALVDCILVIRRSWREAADQWISRHCGGNKVTAPIPISESLHIGCASTADMVTLRSAIAGRGWNLMAMDAEFSGTNEQILTEVRSMRDVPALQMCLDRMMVTIRLTLMCEFDTVQHLTEFQDIFGAEIQEVRIS